MEFHNIFNLDVFRISMSYILYMIELILELILTENRL